MSLALLSSRTTGSRRLVTSFAYSTSRRKHSMGRIFSSCASLDETVTDHDASPWNSNHQAEGTLKKRNKGTRFRQHVNPLARRFQQPTVLTPDWPEGVFEDISLPLCLDIGCGKGGFLLDMADAARDKNFLGLEIRPSVAQFAQERVAKRNLSGRLCFVGCNANVDLDRLLSRHKHCADNAGALEMVTIQFPDPHFKSSHAKRRVVTPELVTTLAKFMPETAGVFLQSDVQTVLDDMRDRFRDQSEYFQDEIANVQEYMEVNPMEVETERERSVLEKDLPVFRTMFRRTSTPVMD